MGCAGKKITVYNSKRVKQKTRKKKHMHKYVIDKKNVKIKKNNVYYIHNILDMCCHASPHQPSDVGSTMTNCSCT